MSSTHRLPRAPHRQSSERATPNAHRRNDAGFGLVETIVTLLIVAIVIPLAYSIIRNLMQQSSNLHDAVASMEQDQLVGRTLTQYLHTAYSLDTSSSSSNVDAYLDAGYSSTQAIPQLATLSAACTMVDPVNGIGKLVVSVAPFGGLPSSTDTYYVQTSTCSLFQYGYGSQGQSNAALTWAANPTPAQLGSAVALQINATLLPGPKIPGEGVKASRPSTLQTTLYLQNATATALPTTSTTLTSTSPATVGAPVTLTASILPVPDGGSAGFTVVQPNGTQMACPASGVSNGQATCNFTPSTLGSYTVYAQYSGDQSFAPSTSATATVSASYATAAALPTTKPSVTATGSNAGTINVAATITSSGGPTPNAGTVQFSVTQTSGTGTKTNVTPSSCQTGIGVVAGSATCPAVPVVTGKGDSYKVSATFVPDSSGTYLSSSATSGSWGY